jgi:hypothetical protein
MKRGVCNFPRRLDTDSFKLVSVKLEGPSTPLPWRVAPHPCITKMQSRCTAFSAAATAAPAAAATATPAAAAAADAAARAGALR